MLPCSKEVNSSKSLRIISQSLNIYPLHIDGCISCLPKIVSFLPLRFTDETLSLGTMSWMNYFAIKVPDELFIWCFWEKKKSLRSAHFGKKLYVALASLADFLCSSCVTQHEIMVIYPKTDTRHSIFLLQEDDLSEYSTLEWLFDDFAAKEKSLWFSMLEITDHIPFGMLFFHPCPFLATELVHATDYPPLWYFMISV